MSKAAVFTMKLEPSLRADFMAAAEHSHRPASQVVRELMRAFVQQEQEKNGYADFLQRKVDAARRSMEEGRGRDDAVVAADFAERRERAARPA